MKKAVRQDLIRLRGNVERNWTRSHCLLTCMSDAHKEDGIYFTDQDMPRNMTMVIALGFADPGAMFDWNDRRGRTKWQVLRRINDALT